jgi:tetratricopeptide (TPR) repeat protein
MCENPDVRRDKRVKAFRAASEAVRLAPDEPLTLYSLLKTQLALEMMDAAWRVAERLRQLSPESELPYEAMGLVALRMEEWDSAEFYFDKTLRLTPESYMATANLGLAQLQQGKQRDAMLTLYSALKMNPSSEFAQEHLDLAVRGYLEDPRWAGVKLVNRMRRERIPTDLGNYIRSKNRANTVRVRSVSSGVRHGAGARAVALIISIAWSVAVLIALTTGALAPFDRPSLPVWIITALVWAPKAATRLWQRMRPGSR